jgi:hypothetical protein
MPKNTKNCPTLPALVIFFEKWKALHPSLLEQLQVFFQKWSGYIPTEDWTSEHSSIDFDCVLSLADFFRNFPLAIKARRRQGYGLNIWNIAGVGRDELRNMAILFWWLRHDGEHGLGETILKGIINRIENNYGESYIPNFNYFSAGYRIYREHTLWDNQGRARRMDILIESDDALIVIEGKINASESVSVEDGQSQLDKYCELAKNLANNRQWAVVYLTPSKRLNTHRRQKQPRLLELTWKEVANVIKRESKCFAKDDVIRVLMESTFNSITTF